MPYTDKRKQLVNSDRIDYFIKLYQMRDMILQQNNEEKDRKNNLDENR